MKWFHRQMARLLGRNTALTPPSVILEQMHTPRPLPMGVTEFHEWSDRIIAGAMVPADTPSLKFALAEMIMHMPPAESHQPDITFIHRLRKGAANQVAFAMMEQLRNERKAALEKAEAEAKLKVVSSEVAEGK